VPNRAGIGDTLLKAKEMMDAGGFRRLPVVHEGQVVGILTERDLREHGGYLKSTKVDAIMRAPVVTVGAIAAFTILGGGHNQYVRV
jgi:CBS domain-containing protein